MIKEYFTDGLLQIAIFLSLLRVDLDSFIGLPPYNSHRLSPELQETFLGSLSGYTQTDIHSRNLWNAAGVGAFIHPKSIYNSYPESIFRDLHSLNYRRTFDGVEHNVNAFLVNGPEPVFPCGQRSSGQATSPDSSQTAGEGNNVPTNDGQEVEGAGGNLDYCSSPDDLTKEEMELIEVLWRQDIDLGIGREMFESTLKVDSDKQDSKEKNSTEEEKKEDQADGSSSSGQFPLLDLSANYVIDGETGEFVPQPPQSQQQPDPVEVVDFLDLPDILFSNQLANVDNDSSDTDLPPLEQLDVSSAQFAEPERSFEEPQMSLIGGDVGNTPNFSRELSRQSSLEQRWQDVMGLLELPEFSVGEISAQLPPEFNVTSVDPPVSYPPEQPLVQNVSLGTVDIPESLLLSQNFQISPLSTYPIFPEADLNNTYQHNTTSLINVTDLSSPGIGFLGTNASFLNMDTTPSLQLEESRFRNLHETNNISDFSTADLESIFQQIFDNNTLDDNSMNFTEPSFSLEEPSGSSSNPLINQDWSSGDSAISSLSSPPMQWLQDVMEQSDGADEASGGKDVTACEMDGEKYPFDPNPSVGSPLSSRRVNSSAASNDTSFRSSKMLIKHVYHNHTYVLQPGQMSREEKEEAQKRDREQKATRSRDEKRAKEMKLPITVDEIIHTPVEDFTKLLSRYSLSEPQQQLIRDIRRRGKNKQAAQNCRKRKLDVIQTFEDEVTGLNKELQSLISERRHLDRETAHVKDKLVRLQTELFRSLRDDNGQPYNPNEYSLQQLPDGNLFLVPKNNTPAENGHAEKPARKRKPKRKE